VKKQGESTVIGFASPEKNGHESHMTTTIHWIKKLNLAPHPEGGFFRETYRADMSVTREEVKGKRNASTAIYFLLRSEDISHLHRIDADEVWHFYAGSALTVHVIHPDGRYENHVLGDIDAPRFQAVVPAGAWFGATVDTKNTYALVGCTVAPGFDFAGFEMANRDEMLSAYPAHETLIKRLTQPT